MYNKPIQEINEYKKILNFLEKKVQEKDFEKGFKKAIEIDLKHYGKHLTLEEIKNIILEYKDLEEVQKYYKNLQVLLPGNPEIVLRICLEAIRYKANMLICIEDFCLAQNTYLIKFVQEVLEELKIKNKIRLKNLVQDKEIIDNSKIMDKTICLGNTNQFNRLEGKLDNFILYPYGRIEVYADTDDFKDLEKVIFDYSVLNEFEIEMYDELDLAEAVDAINRDGYEFCALIISKDKEKVNYFKENINENYKYVILNENPFKVMKFKLEI